MNPCRSRDAVRGALADPEDVFGAARAYLLETTPVIATTNHETCRRSDERKHRFVLMNYSGGEKPRFFTPAPPAPLDCPGHRCVRRPRAYQRPSCAKLYQPAPKSCGTRTAPT